ncbi:MAG: tRNA pseudouridine(13) synthase TruD [Pseudomonadales bacterium]|nr:tRNA pseudouridine(13) synthase TruD [Pseudomonadales bacterium]
MPDNGYPLIFASAYPRLDISAEFKLSADDFCVFEELSFEPEGEGEHVFIQVKKTTLTTEHLIGDIARLLNIAKRDIGYSGLKDKQAVTTQWLSFVWPIKDAIPELAGDNWQVLQSCRHLRKLKRGVHQHNRFMIRLKNISGDRSVMEQRLSLIAAQGVPNYFGMQRFGFGGRNVQKAEDLFEKRFKCKKFQRGLYFSAARSYLFNHYLQQRVLNQNWQLAIDGDCFQLQGTQSVFGPEPLSDDITQRLVLNDIHAVGPMTGQGESRLTLQALKMEDDIKQEYHLLAQGLDRCGLKPMLRALRLIPQQMTWQFVDGCCEIEFILPPGTFATAVLHELADIKGETW